MSLQHRDAVSKAAAGGIPGCAQAEHMPSSGRTCQIASSLVPAASFPGLPLT